MIKLPSFSVFSKFSRIFRPLIGLSLMSFSFPFDIQISWGDSEMDSDLMDDYRVIVVIVKQWRDAIANWIFYWSNFSLEIKFFIRRVILLRFFLFSLW